MSFNTRPSYHQLGHRRAYGCQSLAQVIRLAVLAPESEFTLRYLWHVARNVSTLDACEQLLGPIVLEATAAEEKKVADFVDTGIKVEKILAEAPATTPARGTAGTGVRQRRLLTLLLPRVNLSRSAVPSALKMKVGRRRARKDRAEMAVSTSGIGSRLWR